MAMKRMLQTKAAFGSSLCLPLAGDHGSRHLPPRITIFFCVTSPMNDLTRLKATGKSLGAETHRSPLGS